MTGEEAPDQPGDARTAVVSAFLDQVRFLADWEWRRAEGFQSKAGLLLGACGVILSLLVGSLRGLPDESLVQWIAAGSVTLVVAAAVCAVVALFPRRFTVASRSDLWERWTAYTENRGDITEGWQVDALSVSNVLLPDGTSKSSLDSLAADADSRSRWFRLGAIVFLAALVSLTALTLTS